MDHGPIETSRGYRPPPSGGERLLVGLATVALLGGMIVGLVNVLTPDGEEVAEASPSATVSPSRTPRPHTTPTPFPNPPPAQVVVAGEPQSQPPDAAWRYVSGWMRVTADTALRAGPADGATVMRELHPGDLAFAYASEVEGWLTTNDGYYIRADDPAMELVTSQLGQQGGDILSVVGGPGGFVVTGARPSTAWYDQARFVAWSVDGARWAARDDSSAAGLGDVLTAWGPSGWLSVVQDWNTSRTWVQTSDDGLRWEWAGSLQLLPDAWPTQLIASEDGYLLVANDWSRNRASRLAWYTTDGRTWEERPALPSSRDAELRLTGVRGGFLLWEDNGAGVSFSSDALSWSEASGPDAPSVMVAQLGGGARAVALDGVGRATAWIGEAFGRGWRWRADPSVSVFDGAVVTNVAGSAERALAVGFDASDASPRAWINDGDGWSAAPLPPAYRGIPQRIAVGPADSALLIGYRPTLRGDNPILWRLGPGGWTPERQPLVPVVPDPAGSECGPPPADAVELWALERARGPACLDGVQITLRAWAARCDGCYGEALGRFEEGWLANPSTNVLYLSPHESDDDGNWAPAVLAPDLRYDPAWVHAWLEVTGHFNDPAAADCRYVPAPTDGWWQSSRESLIVQCREQFVVTSVTVVDGP